MIKQSSVEWLAEKFTEDSHNQWEIKVLVNRALQMHKEERLQDFKEGFQAALESLQGANNLVQSKKLGGNNE